MRRIIIQGLLACLLALFPALSLAQTLTSYEYWFDDDIEECETGSLSGTVDAVNIDVSARSLSQGLHTLHFRAKQSDGYYSSVTSSTFLKIAAGLGNKLEYWIDDDISKAVMIEGSEDSDGTYKFITSLDMRAVSPGLHRLNLRPRSTSGKTAGAITTADFIKISTGFADKLEYWIDGDCSTVHIIEGQQDSDGSYVFITNLDLGDVTPGYHRLYYRAVSSTDLIASAVSMTPIIVKSRYYHDENEPVTVRHYSISVDDEEPMVHDVLDPKEEYKYNRKLDARYLSQGQHTLKATFWNSLGTSVYVEQPFTVKVPEPGQISLTATEQDGLVKLEYNNVPNNVKHNILRTESGGRWRAVHSVKEHCNEDVVSHYIDIPSAAGTYTYKVKSRYENFDGSTDTVVSNLVTVTVAHSHDELTNYGYIIGQVPDMYPLVKHAYFSDGKHVPFTGNHFSREMIPVGTELTIEVMESTTSETYYKPVTLTVKAGENAVTFETLTGEDRPFYDEHHLEFASDLEWTGMNFIFDVKNHGRDKWNGRVRLRAISKKEDEQGGGDDGGSGSIFPGSGDAGAGAGSVAPMPVPNVTVEKNYYYAYSEPISLWPGGTATVTLSLDNLFPDDKKEEYVFYIESEGQYRDGVYGADEIRLVAVNKAGGYNVTENPMTRLIDKSLLEQAKDEIAMQNAEYAANLVVMIASYIKAFDGMLGNLQNFYEFMTDLAYKQYGISKSQYNAMMEEALNTSETFDDFLNSRVVQELPELVMTDLKLGITKTVRQDILGDIIKYGKGVKKYLGFAMDVLKYVKKYKEWQDMNEYDKTFYCAEAILDYVEKTNPFAALVKPYVDVGKSMIYKALQYGEAYNAGYEAQDLYEKKVEFKIKVQTNRLVDFNFDWFGTSQIQEVKVMVSNRQPHEVDTIYFEPEGVWDGVMLRQTRYIGKNPESGGGNLDFGVPIKRMWMEIKWLNGRTSKVPLVGKNDEPGVSYDPLHRRYTVHFKSGTTKYEHIADIIHLKN